MTIDGHEPGDVGFILTVENTPAVRAWLVSEGLDPARVAGMRNDSLAKAYRYPAYLRQMKTRADYYPPCRKDTSHAQEEPRRETGDRGLPRCADPPECDAREPPLDDGPGDQGTESAGAGRTGIREAEPTLTEARVVELIEEHAIRVIMERLQLGELLK